MDIDLYCDGAILSSVANILTSYEFEHGVSEEIVERLWAIGDKMYKLAEKDGQIHVDPVSLIEDVVVHLENKYKDR